MKETLGHMEAFNYYYLLGKKRGLRKVGQKYDVSRSAVGKWSKAFHWPERVRQTDLEVSKILKERLKETAVNSKNDYRELAKEVFDKFKEKLEEGKIKITKIQDIIEMIKLDLVMMGEPIGRDERKIEALIVKISKVKDDNRS